MNIKGVIDFTTERYIRLDESKKEKLLLHDGDILFNWRNGSLDHIGKVAFWENPTKNDTYHVSFLLKVRTDKTQLNPYYLWAYLDKLHKSGYYRKASRRQINIKFNATGLSNVSVPVPPIGLQQDFVDRINEAKPIVEQQKNSASRIVGLSQSLLQMAFMGEV